MYEKNKTTNKFLGFSIDLLYELAELMDFDYELYEAPDGKFGHMNEDGEWNGMIKELVEDVR